jgi:hypothetical protein
MLASAPYSLMPSRRSGYSSSSYDWHSLISLWEKRRRAAALQDAAHNTMIPEIREASWSAPPYIGGALQEAEMSARSPHELLCANDNMNRYSSHGFHQPKLQTYQACRLTVFNGSFFWKQICKIKRPPDSSSSGFMLNLIQINSSACG